MNLELDSGVFKNMINEKYEDYLKYELNYSENTIKDYIFNIGKYYEYLKEHNIDYKKISKEEIIEMLKYFDEQKLTNRSIANHLSSLRNYYDYLVDQKIIKTNIFKIINNPKLDKKLPNFLSYEDMRQILDSIDDKAELDIRNKLIIELFYATGVRVSELVNIKINDIDMNNKTIRIFGKGRKERIVYFGDYAKDAISNYLSIRSYTSEYLVLNSKGSKITTRGIEKIVDKIAQKASVNNNVTPHTFRHTFATHLINNGSDIKSVQELLGHESLSATEVYTHITSEFLKSEYLKNMPRK